MATEEIGNIVEKYNSHLSVRFLELAPGLEVKKALMRGDFAGNQPLRIVIHGRSCPVVIQSPQSMKQVQRHSMSIGQDSVFDQTWMLHGHSG